MAVSVDAVQMLENLAESYDAVSKFVTAFAYVIGMAFVFAGISKFKAYGQAKTMMSSNAELKAPLVLIMVGAVLLYLPNAVEILLDTAWGYQHPLGYTENKGTTGGRAMFAVFKLIQLVGIIAFVRGWVILAQSAKQGAQPQLSKAATHIIGGIAAINIVGTKNLISASFGLNW